MNERDLIDAQARGERMGDEIFDRAMRKWNRVEVETSIGLALDQAKRAGAQIPAQAAKQLEVRYGESS